MLPDQECRPYILFNNYKCLNFTYLFFKFHCQRKTKFINLITITERFFLFSCIKCMKEAFIQCLYTI